ncbi:NADPH:quinone oxidoreductase family protein [Pseudomonas sp. SbOxS1]|uniref:NADPH:quinone oxidoreductase family protein n=1 Tax=Pseudomonas sp. SbOxS1 TaxID=2723884 RepID=UPI00211F1890|nr:NADPH:quinone oxidoreductase family protein [Pseudomonas sp. SbOxS1]
MALPPSPMQMYAVVGQELKLESYQLRRVDVPEPGVGEVRIAIKCTGVGFADGLLSTGQYQLKPPLPFIPGCEFSGVIDALGPQVINVDIGQPVSAIAMGGGFAEYAVVPQASLTRLPNGMGFAEAAVCWVDYTTALHALRDRGRVRPDETVLVLGAAGGLGQAAIQIARLLGARVIAAASSLAKRETALKLGAWQVLEYTDSSWTEQLKALTEGRGVDVIFDPVGGAGLETAFRRLAWGGRHLVLGFAGGTIPALPTNLPLLKGGSLIGVDVRQFDLYQPLEAAEARAELAQLIAAKRLQPETGRRFTMAQFAEALAASLDRQRIGKTVLEISSS